MVRSQNNSKGKSKGRTTLNLDDERILRNQVTREEVTDLEGTLIEMFLRKVKEEQKTLTILSDARRYDRLRTSGELFNGGSYFLLIDSDTGSISDILPIAYHLLGTEEGKFYAKFMLQNGYLHGGKHPST